MDQLMTVREVSSVLQISEDRVYSLVREQVLDSVRLGRSIRFSKASLEEFISNGGKALPGVWKREP